MYIQDKKLPDKENNMDLILLPGKNSSNAGWIGQVENALKPSFNQTQVQYYKHWEHEEGGLINMEEELHYLTEIADRFSDYCVFAKSAGVILALQAMATHKIKPKKCFFVGSAFLWALTNQLPLEQWLANYSTPTLFIQQTLDPAMYSDELKKFLDLMNVNNYELKEIPGKSHQYGDVEELSKLVKDFVLKV